MTAPKIPDADFIKRFQEVGPTKLAAELVTPIAGVMRRRRHMEAKYNLRINGPEHPASLRIVAPPQRLAIDCGTGVGLVGSDAHYWPGDVSVAHRAFVHFAALLQPRFIVVNGDDLDGARISRHPPNGWSHRPTVMNELEECKERLGEIVKAAPRRCKRIRTRGNHDNRFENYLAINAPEMAGVGGTSLADHFTEWEQCVSVWVNDSVVIKHRFKGGIHATHSNALWAGKSMISGHLHSAQVRPLTDYNGTRYGVDTGCLADPFAPAFDYAEDNPRNWRSGFAVLTFRDGLLLQPELVLAWDAQHVQFRGELVRV